MKQNSNKLRNRKLRDLNFPTFWLILENEILSSMVPFLIAGQIWMAGIIEYYVETLKVDYVYTQT